MGDQIRVNGNILSYGSLKATIASEIFTGFTSVGWDHKRERTKVHGMSPDQGPRARTRGKYTPGPVKLKGPKSTMQALKAALADLSSDGFSYGDVEFPMVLQGIEAEESFVVEFERCTFTGTSSTFEEGAEGLMEECELDVMYIYEDGLQLWGAAV
jgi:hypothetical protein